MKALVIVFTAAFGLQATAATCKLDPKSVTIGWTAFKTSDKVPVKGEFKKVTVTGKTSGKNLTKLADGLKVTADAASLDTANPARNDTIYKFFFSKLAKIEISGKIAHFAEAQKSFTLVLNFNGQTKDVPMTFEQKGDDITAAGTMDIATFGGGEALTALNTQCKDLHKGKDGVSKTWSEVALNFAAKVACK